MLFGFYYTAKNRKLFVLGFLILLIGSIGDNLFQHLQYNHWLEQAGRINPGIRNQQVVLGNIITENSELASAYRETNLSNQYEGLDMYSKQEERQEISNRYLGSDGNRHYFAIGDDGNYAFRYVGEVNYTDEPSHMTGISFYLKDPRFEHLGFTKESEKYLETVYVNRKDVEKASGEIPLHVVDIPQVFLEWIDSRPI